MSPAYQIALRYLFAKKSNNSINLITWISIIAMTLVSAAIIVVLSVFNGLTLLIMDMYGVMDSDLQIVAVKGRVFLEDDEMIEKMKNLPGVVSLSEVIEGKVALKYEDRQHVAIIKGVKESFLEINPINDDQYLFDGVFDLKDRNGYPQGVMGIWVRDILRHSLYDEREPVKIYVLRDKPLSMLDPLSTIKEDAFFPSGYFSIQREYDEKYVIVNYEFARDLFEFDQEVTSIELKLKEDNRQNTINQIKEIIGPELRTRTAFEQHETLYRVMKNEKYIAYLILTLMLIIAAITVVGSLSVIVFEKQRDISVLRSIGATKGFIRRTFLTEGFFVGFIGGAGGALLALIFDLLQKYVGIIPLVGGSSFLVEYYPVEIEWIDFVLVFLTVLLLAMSAAIYPASKAVRFSIVHGLRK